jgi:hypothetical protein
LDKKTAKIIFYLLILYSVFDIQSVEYLSRDNKSLNVNYILSPNQVFDILINFNISKNWPKALQTGVPAKWGLKIPEGN